MSSQALYDQALLDTLKAGENWESWFNPDISGEEVECLEDFTLSANAAKDMLLDGITYWSNPGWLRDIGDVLYQWAAEGYLIKVRLISQWLIAVMPSDLLDEELSAMLFLLADGDFCTAFQGMRSQWPQSINYYGQTLNLRMAAIAVDIRAQMNAGLDAAMVMKRMHGGDLQDYITLPVAREVA